MKLTKKQKELDIMKWEESVEQGYDACGSFLYCVKCDKALSNPCDKALRAYEREMNGQAKNVPSEPAKRGSRAEKKAQIAATADKMKNIYANKDRVQ